MKKLRALVVDDSAYNRLAISQMLEGDPDISVIGTAVDGTDAIARTLRLEPDLITLDLEMPGMDGFTFLRWLMREQPTPVIVISSRSDSRSVIRALELGAVDFLAKPEARISRSIEVLRDGLLAKAQAVRELDMARVRSAVELAARRTVLPQAQEAADEREPGPIELVAIACSTGGPPALQAILTSLPRNFAPAIAISQHMPAGFTRSFAERLNKLSHLTVMEAAPQMRFGPGTALIAPGGFHLLVKRERGRLVAVLEEGRPSDKYVPSGDRMMRSAAEVCGPALLGIVLTGMGNDGSEGSTAIKKRNGHVLAESEETAVIFGMPREAIERGAVDQVVPLGRMAEEIVERCRARTERILP